MSTATTDEAASDRTFDPYQNRSPVHSNIRKPHLPGVDYRFEAAFEEFVRALRSNPLHERHNPRQTLDPAVDVVRVQQRDA